MSDAESNIFATAVVYWLRSRQGGIFYDQADLFDAMTQVAEDCGVTLSPGDLTAIRALVVAKIGQPE